MSAFVVSNDRSDGTPNVPNANATGKWRSILWRRNRQAGQGTSTSVYLWDDALVAADPVYLKWVPIGNFIATTDLLSLQAGSTKLSITSSAGNVYFDAVESAFTIANISGDLPLSKLPATVALIDAANTFSLHNTFSNGLTGDITGNATTATTLRNSRSIYLTGDAVGSVSHVDWSQDVTINTTVTPLAVESNLPHWNASHLMSRVIGNQTPVNGDVYAWDQGNQEWTPVETCSTVLPNLLDVTISSPADGQFIKYVSASSDWENFSPTTDNITEGTNLYYTDERVDDRLSTLIQEGTGINHVYDDAANTYTLSVDFGDFSTSDLAEGTNLYYTEARWDARLATKTTDDLTEGSSNLYFTDARARAALSVTGDITYSSTTGVFSHIDAIQSVNAATGTVVLGTDDIAEGSTNLYYTEARVAANTAVTANTAKITNVTTDLSVSRDGTKIDVVSSDGTNAVLPLADTDNWGVMSDEMFDKLDGIEAGATSEAAASTTVAGIVELATNAETTAGTDTARAVTPAGVQAAVDEILDGAPAALDTLNELAAAIDDDASYASTITTALGFKAPIASPTFTGTVAIPNISDLEAAVAASTAKTTNATTDLSVSRDGTKLDVVSSDGTNAVLPLADTDNWGVMSDEMFDEHTANNAKTGITSGQASAIVANTAKATNVTTDLSVSRDGTKLDVVSSDGTNAVLPLADTNNWGVMSDEMFDEHEANNAKVSDVNHNVTTDLSVSRDGTKLDVVSSDGTNAVLPLADTNNWGVMSDEMFDEHTANNAKVSDVNHNATHTGDVTGAAALTIADNAVSLAKMAGLARGSVIIGDSSGDPAALAIGTNTYVLTSDGTDISWAAGGSGSGGHAIKDESGTALTARSNLDFLGELVSAVDNSGDDSTDITIDAKTAWLYG